MTRRTTPQQLGTILSIWAHPDDETYLAAGVMAAAAANGQRVVCVSATAGERGTDDPATWPPDRLGRIRRWEAAAAMAVIGVGEHRFLDLPDGELPTRDADGQALVDRLVDELRPDTILTFGPDGVTYHPDHIAVHHWATRAWHRHGRTARLLYAASTVEHLAVYREHYERWGVYMTDDRPVGVADADVALGLRLTGSELDRKLTALSAMASQTRAVMDAIAEDIYRGEIAEETFVDACA